MESSKPTDLSDHIAGWMRLAEEAESFAAYEEGRGHFGNVYRHKAEVYRRTARALELEAETGRAHCSCCLLPGKFHGAR